MLYVDILAAMIVVVLMVAVVYDSIVMQQRALEEAIRQEKAQIIGENMFWQTVLNDPSFLQKFQSTFQVDFSVNIDGHTYIVTIKALKYTRPK
ncbi:hypothetical protein [Fervidobacterium thailandense]|uniref:Type II secretion system protein n=1 Tax=Fervidobacterium thailandense TaxID=1008305 RepID=A0A1E3G655_9BACT|nr:hypothetical protein [Fervidobacterium thailandense]ODN31353.1 hypothetical protein A4H02_00900 [Fervidobacterium thailandense]